MKFRSGTADDATTLALILDAAGRRIPAYFCSVYAADRQSFFEFGRENIRTNDEGKSFHKNWQIAELARRELIPFPFSQDTGDIILMGKKLCG